MKNRKLLMIPGPIEFTSDVMRAMGMPTTSHVAANFIEVFGQALEDLRKVFLSPAGQPFVVPGSGTLAMDMAAANVIERGDQFTTAYGAWGSLNSRAGFMVESADELPKAIRDYVPMLVAPYFEAVAAWYEKLRIGATGGDLWKTVHGRIGDPFFGVHLNPGHLARLCREIYSAQDQAKICTHRGRQTWCLSPESCATLAPRDTHRLPGPDSEPAAPSTRHADGDVDPPGGTIEGGSK